MDDQDKTDICNRVHSIHCNDRLKHTRTGRPHETSSEGFTDKFDVSKATTAFVTKLCLTTQANDMITTLRSLDINLCYARKVWSNSGNEPFLLCKRDIAGHCVDHNEPLVPISLTFDHRDEIPYIEFHHATVSDIESTRLNCTRDIELSLVLDALNGKLRDLDKARFID